MTPAQKLEVSHETTEGVGGSVDFFVGTMIGAVVGRILEE